MLHSTLNPVEKKMLNGTVKSFLVPDNSPKIVARKLRYNYHIFSARVVSNGGHSTDHISTLTTKKL